ncbi:Fe-S protein assembly co-chaperone HscB [Rodentibacter caecimuris]|uniref:Fe-S protein assembly co-chaperone HscB n=1 Tax=Rodentibacter caecimuris TaxID=1796644 RepID=UPI001094A88E|nr:MULTISPECIES: Fe-S protein assembly co-chaperone HscB [Pasteurellaceae]MCR1836927.1 Fe-S protein assembly co-chaperone HscB [Pasteurella caecimuris]MCU0107230.1 Fe-S protein assembly co-chaperone HscB [Pasteurella caecimuris]MCX2961077.1 Fe-S protein assembly co-chaperone HscB [Rodentibacter heylii]QIA76600.1 Fe-S protein assembly co-chaperone HscB [Rodentibacter heylii]TGY48794.1 Fe-S protein assembly co-chaperone HscB [Pasteurella caecimuris]
MLNPFEIFNLPVDFQLDMQSLNTRYLEMQKTLHPDNFVSSTAVEQRIAMQKSTEVNDALKTLKDPILRAEAIILMNTGEQKDLEQKSVQDVAFLMQQLQWRERLENLENQKDETALDNFAKEIKQETLQLLTALSDTLRSQQWEKASQLCDKLRFTRKLTEEIERVEEHLFTF